MTEMPTLGSSRKSPTGKVALVAIIALLLAGGAIWWRVSRRRHPSQRAQAAANTSHAEKPNRIAAGPPPSQLARAASHASPSPTPRPPSAEELLAKAGFHHVSAVINGPLETAIVSQVGKDPGEKLTQLVTRTLVWWVAVPGDLRKGDELDFLVETPYADEPVIDAVRFRSEKLGRTFRAYRFREKGAPFARFYQPDGSELELRLVDAPLDDYEQVTSLLRDGRGHKGVDFKTPVGTPVRATFDGRVVRKSWSFRFNGNSLEIRRSGGDRTAFFLHLSEIADGLHVGSHVSRGQVIAKSGNTGHSFAPHLHYQLENGRKKILDPFAVQKTVRRSLPASARPAFAAEMARLDKLMNLEVAKN